jgi:DNA-binding MarR family transcriptional regulator
MRAEKMDAVDRIAAQWAVERPELDSSPMQVIGRIHRVAALLDAGLRPPFAEEGLGNGDFDVLASLRRAGAPFRLTPTELTATMMVTSGAVTKRVDRLEKAGLVRRSVAEHDARGRLIELTERGVEVVDRLVVKHWANEDRLLSALDPGQRAQLVDLLRLLLLDLDD